MKRVALVCPGRGTYARSELGSLFTRAELDALRETARECAAREDGGLR